MATQHSPLSPPHLPPQLMPSIAHRLGTRPDMPWCRVEREVFDDALADGATVHGAGRRAGRTAAQAERQFARVCVELGNQAR